MAGTGDLYQSADWKKEKHVPVIECPDEVNADEMFEVKGPWARKLPIQTPQNIIYGGFYYFLNRKGTRSAIKWGTLNSPPMVNLLMGRIQALYTPIIPSRRSVRLTKREHSWRQPYATSTGFGKTLRMSK